MRTTERYAHDDADPLERGAARVARRIATPLAREPDAEPREAKAVVSPARTRRRRINRHGDWFGLLEDDVAEGGWLQGVIRRGSVHHAV